MSGQRSTPGEVVIVGAGGHGASLIETITACGFVVRGFVDRNSDMEVFHGYPVVADIPPVGKDLHRFLALGAGDNQIRERLFSEACAGRPIDVFPTFVHPSASVAANAAIGPGTVVMQAAVIGSAAKVGHFCICNSGSILEHEAVMEDFSSLAPRAVAAGRVRIGRRSAVALGAAVLQGVTIGEDSLLGSNSYLNRDLGPRTVAYGTPARDVRSSK